MDGSRHFPVDVPTAACCRFSGFTLNLARGELLCDAGKKIELRPKSFELLQYLAENAGRLVSRETLMQVIWPNVFVTEDNISQCVTEIRRALGDKGSRLIRTFPKRGYLLEADTPNNAIAPIHTSASSARASLVVLPFSNLSGDPEQDYFADGMVEDLTAALSRIRWLLVVARNSAFTFKGQVVDVQEVGRKLGVRYVLEGSVRKANGRLRITAELVEAETRGHVWSDRFEGELADIFGLQDQVTESVAGAIEPSLRLAEIERARSKPTENLDAYDLYLRALPHHYAQTKFDNDTALNLLQRAVALDPSFGLAKAFAAYTIMIREVHGWLQPGEALLGARLAREALSDSRDDPATLRCAGQAISWLEHDRERGLAAVERALMLNPNSAQAHGGAAWTSLYAGYAERAIKLFQRAIRLGPLDPEISYCLSGLGYAYLMAQRYVEALDAALKAVAEMPERGTGYRAAIAALHALGRTEEARAMARRYHSANPAGCRVFAERVAATFTDQIFAATMVNGLRAAGVPE